MLTSQEFEAEMQKKEDEKNRKEQEKLDRQNERKRRAEEKAKGKENVPKRKRNQKKQKAAGSQPKAKKSKTIEPEESDASNIDSPRSSQSASEEQDELCGSCGKSFLKDFDGQKWVKCMTCQVWYHMLCQNLGDDEYSVSFQCSKCVVPIVVTRRLRKRKV